MSDATLLQAARRLKLEGPAAWPRLAAEASRAGVALRDPRRFPMPGDVVLSKAGVRSGGSTKLRTERRVVKIHRPYGGPLREGVMVTWLPPGLTTFEEYHRRRVRLDLLLGSWRSWARGGDVVAVAPADWDPPPQRPEDVEGMLRERIAEAARCLHPFFRSGRRTCGLCPRVKLRERWWTTRDLEKQSEGWLSKLYLWCITQAEGLQTEFYLRAWCTDAQDNRWEWQKGIPAADVALVLCWAASEIPVYRKRFVDPPGGLHYALVRELEREDNDG